jgi:RNA-directed DNA polymerase
MNRPNNYGWNTINWREVNEMVFKWQCQIYSASRISDIKTVRKIQTFLLNSNAAKYIAIRTVTQDNRGKKTAGVDNISKLTPDQRMHLVSEMKFPTKVLPLRRVWIPKPGTSEQRPLGMTIKDRCLQALLKLALEPEWEAKFEPNSYGFRPGRNAHDAVCAILKSIQHRPKYVLDADISKCFDKIDHQALLNKTGLKGKYRKQIQYWLEAGVLDNEVFAKTETGTPPFGSATSFASFAFATRAKAKEAKEAKEERQAREARQGGVISPLLANIALHGMETYLKDCFSHIPVYYSSGEKRRGANRKDSLAVIRYADDLVILHADILVVQHCKKCLIDFLKTIGLELSSKKTRLTNTLELKPYLTPEMGFDGKVGFNFLGFTIKQYKTKHRSVVTPKKTKPGFKSLIYPSAKSIKKHQEELHNLVFKQGKALNQTGLIKKLNPIIRGWANYFGKSNASTTGHLHKQDYLIYLKLRQWAKRQKKGKASSGAQYWQRVGNRKWVFKSKDAQLLEYISYSTPLGSNYVKVKGDYSPFNHDQTYWNNRLYKDPANSSRVNKLLKKQEGICAWCGTRLQPWNVKELDHKISLAQGGIDKSTNWQVLHGHCHDLSINDFKRNKFSERLHMTTEVINDLLPRSGVIGKPSCTVLNRSWVRIKTIPFDLNYGICQL